MHIVNDAGKLFFLIHCLAVKTFAKVVLSLIMNARCYLFLLKKSSSSLGKQPDKAITVFPVFFK